MIGYDSNKGRIDLFIIAAIHFSIALASGTSAYPLVLNNTTNSKPRKKRIISLRWLMALVFGGLVALSVGLVLALSVIINLSNTYSLLNSRASLLIDNMEHSIRAQTRQAERAVKAVANLYAEGELLIGRLDKQQESVRYSLLKSMMIAAPVVEALLIYDLQNRRSGIFKSPQGVFSPIPFGEGIENDQLLALAENALPGGNKVIWGEPVMVNNILFHNVGFPLEKNGKIEGYAVAAIGQNNMNKIIAELGRHNETTVFVLTSDNKVIAHSNMPGFLEGKPGVDINTFPDTALNQFEGAQEVNIQKEILADNDTPTLIYEAGHGLMAYGYIYILRELEGYAAKPYRLGAYFAKADAVAELRKIMGLAMTGIAALLLAVFVSFLISRRLSKPMKKIAKVANDFSELELSNYTPLPSSRIREIDDQAKAMNAMHVALGEFAHYIPRTLVKRLMASGKEATRSVEREVTIMFADIVGFTSVSEDLNASETASVLNSHFDMLCRRIDRNNGTVDKFIGDGLMAFWGAPDADEDQAANAIRTAGEILEMLKTQNLQRQQNALPPMRLRIGIHTGRAVVGNIGSCDRHNYTIVGDTVNVANRLEQYGKQFIGENQAIVLTSRATWEKAGRPDTMHSLGLQKLRGRGAMIEIFAMDDTNQAQAALSIQQSAS